jgi:hypothetical protein
MPTAQTVREVVDRVVVGTATEREKAIALHNYVRDNVKFGFTKYFDAAEPDYTLTCGIGHCNPKSRLMMSLFRAIGLESYQHFVAIPKDILKGVFPPSRSWMLKLPAQLGHCYVEVKVEGAWCAIDSYIIDPALLKAAQARLAKQGRTLGFGVRADSTNVWDGQSNAFSQFDHGMMTEDHGRVDDIEGYFRTGQYPNQVLGVRFNTIFALLGNFGVAPINSHLDGIRTSYVE